MNDEPRTPNTDETPAEVERALRALADLETDDGIPAPDDERLLAYREGTLGEEEARAVERELARSAGGRRRLLELAGNDRSLPLRRVRKAVLAATEPRRRQWLPGRPGRTMPWLGLGSERVPRKPNGGIAAGGSMTVRGSALCGMAPSSSGVNP